MVTTQSQPRPVIIEAFVLACTKSKLRDVVGPDALRTVLNANYLDMMSAGTLDLQMIWDVLAEQPGFDADLAYGAFCRFKTWESELGIHAKLPATMRQFKVEDVHRYSATVPVKREELDRVLGRDTRKKDSLYDQAIKATESGGMAPLPKEHRAQSPFRRALPFIAGGIALLSIGYLSWFLISELRGPSFEDVSAVDLGDLPVEAPKRLGPTVHATLTDSAWLSLPEDQRRSQLKRAFERIQVSGIDGLVVFDKEKRVVASVQSKAGSLDPTVRFP